MQKYIIAWREMVEIVVDFIATPKIKNMFLWGIVLYAIALFALIHGDIYYADDWGTSSMETSWNHFSRYLGTFILNDLATFGKGNVDSSPLLQIMAVILVMASSLILIYLIRKKFDLIGILASLPLGLSPHFLQNLSYKFESLFMCVALFCAIVPFLFKENRRVFIAVSVISLLCMFMTYQAANGTYIILSLYFAFSAYFLEKRNFKESAIFLAICAMNLIMASLFYKIIIVQPISEYVVLYISDKAFPIDSILLGAWANLATYLTTIFNDLKNTPYIWLVALMSVFFVINTTIHTNHHKIATIFATIIFLLLGICLSYGLYLVLEKPLFQPRAFYGFNALVAVLCIANISLLFRHSEGAKQPKNPQIKSDIFLDYSLITFAQNNEVVNSHSAPPHLQKIAHYISCVVVVIVAYFLISFANIYGNALKKQDEYLEFRARLLLSDLSNVIPTNATITIYTSKIGNAKVTQRFYDKYGFYALIPQLAKVDDFWFNMRLRHLNAPYILNNSEMCEFIKENFGSEVVFKNANHKIERAKSCYFVTLNK